VLDLLKLGTELNPVALEGVSLREGVRSFRLRWRGVEILVVDETTLMETGTYKDLDACVTMAKIVEVGYENCALSSGGNLNYAVARYANRAGVGAFLFNPTTTLYKLDGQDFGSGSHLIAVDLPERKIKDLARTFARHYGILHVPDLRWRLAASAMRAMYLIEEFARSGPVKWLAQTMCAGYGPAGIYSCFSELGREGLFPRAQVPKFLGFQQDSNAPMVRAWKDEAREIARSHLGAAPDKYIEPGLYNTNPEGNYTRLFDLMKFYGGDLMTIGAEDYGRYAGEVISLLAEAGVALDRIGTTDAVREKSPVLTGVGILKAIERGLLVPGDSVAFMVTGGARQVNGHTQPRPSIVIDDSESLDEWVATLGELFSLRAITAVRRSDRLFSDALVK
jgi:hypothetical protein